MVRVVERSKLSLIIIVYLEILTISAETSSNKQSNLKRTLNSRSAQESNLNNQLKSPQKEANQKLNNERLTFDSAQSNVREESANSDIDNGDLKSGSTIILEELVDRFMEKNSDAVRRGDVLNGGRTINSGDSNPSDDYLAHLVNSQTNDSFLDEVPYSTPPPFMQLMNAQLNEEPKSNDLFSAASQHDSDLDTDRHIQYDVVESEQTTRHRAKLYPRHAISELSVLKLTNYTTNNSSEYESLADGRNSSQAQMKQPEQSKQKGYSPAEIYPEQNQIFMLTNYDKSGQDQIVATISNSSSSIPRIVQARSMSNGINKTPQHTRPPYATYDQFHHRTDANSNKQASSEQSATPSMLASSLPTTGAAQVIALSNSNLTANRTTNSSNVQDATTLVQSFSRISSQLAHETARGESGKQHTDKDQNLDEGNNVNSKEQLQQQLHKLASSTDQLVELNPIPIPIPMSDQPSSGDQIQFKEGLDRFYFSKENQLFGHPSHELSTRGQSVDKYSNNDQSVDSSINGGPNNYFNINEISSNHHQLAKIASQYPGYDSSKLVSLLDSRSGHESFNNKLQNNERTKESLMEDSNRDPDKHHYAASLVNVTAPMILPLSATEAMESSLGDQVGAKNLLHQVSGFLRPPSSEVAKSAASTTKLNQPPRLSQYYVSPLQATSPDLRLPMQQSIYSQPANQFSPKPHVNTEANLLTSASASNESYLEERMRLNRNNGYNLAGRKPPVGGYTVASGHVNHANNSTHQASGFRSPLSHSSTTSTTVSLQGSSGTTSTPIWPPTRLPTLSNYLSGSLNPQMAAAASERPPPTTINNMMSSTSSMATPSSIFADSRIGSSSTLSGIVTDHNNSSSRPPPQSGSSSFPMTATTGSINGMVNAVGSNNNSVGSNNGTSLAGTVIGSSGEIPSNESGLTRPVFNLTRVEHISAECSNDLIRTVIIFNGTFKGIIYSSGYVRDPNCVYINGTGKTRYQFNIRLNQCGTLGRQELHPPVGPNEIRRRDQVMWNTLSIQYNPIIEQEWDEHFRVSCEYGSDFWKTVSFNPFNVETNTGSPVVFTVDPPQCQMEILRGHGMVGPRQEAVSGPVTVGDPLTLLIHMKSEKAGYDILVKNCIAHDGAHQKMQLIDNNGCVVNERFISPFRGTYNDNDMKHVTLYAFLKAFRFTGSPVLYLECEIHMCQSSCPPQMCYWRKLSKRSAALNETTSKAHDYPMFASQVDTQVARQLEDEFLNEEFSDDNRIGINNKAYNHNQEDIQIDNQTRTNFNTVIGRRLRNTSGRGQLRKLNFGQTEEGEEEEDGGVDNESFASVDGTKDKRLDGTGGVLKGKGRSKSVTTVKPLSISGAAGQISDKVSLFQALEVRQERAPDDSLFPSPLYSTGGFLSNHNMALGDNMNGTFESASALTSTSSLMCYRRAEILAFLFTTISVILVAISISVGFCWRAANLRKIQRQDKQIGVGSISSSGGLSSANLISRMSSINNLLCKNQTGTTGTTLADSSSMSSCSLSPASLQRDNNHHPNQNPHSHSHSHSNHHHHCVVDSSLVQSHPNQLRLSPILQHHSARHKGRPF